VSRVDLVEDFIRAMGQPKGHVRLLFVLLCSGFIALQKFETSGVSKPETCPVPFAANETISVFVFCFDRLLAVKRLMEQLGDQILLPGMPFYHLYVVQDYDPMGRTTWKSVRAYVGGLGKAVPIHSHMRVTPVLHMQHMGLRETMLYTWLPADVSSGAIFLEDDIVVSPLLFYAAARFTAWYRRLARDLQRGLLGMRAYNQKYDEGSSSWEVRPSPEDHPAFRIQEPCSWGTIYMGGAYLEYIEWLSGWFASHGDGRIPVVPGRLSNGWNPLTSAKMYQQRYMWETGSGLLAVNLPRNLSLSSTTVMLGTNILRKEWIPTLKKKLDVPLATIEELALVERVFQFLCVTPPSDVPSVTMDRRDAAIVPATPGAIADVDALPLSDSLLSPPHESINHRIESRFGKMVLDLIEDPYIADFGTLVHTKLSSYGYIAGMWSLLQKVDIEYTNSLSAAELFVLVRAHYSQYRTIFLQPMNGLGNRLRAMASAIALGRATNRWVVFIWDPAVDCQAKLSDVLQLRGSVIELSSGAWFTILQDSISPADRIVLDPELNPLDISAQINGEEDGKHIFAKMFSVIQSPSISKSLESSSLVELLSWASKRVQVTVTKYMEKVHAFDPTGSWQAVHCRMVVPGVKDTMRMTPGMMALLPDRLACSAEHFLRGMMTNPRARFVVSTDSPDLMKKLLRTEYRDLRRIVLLLSHESECLRLRNASCIVNAFAEILVLVQSRTNFWKSDKSSFSEIISLATQATVSSGCDETITKGDKAIRSQVVRTMKPDLFMQYNESVAHVAMRIPKSEQTGRRARRRRRKKYSMLPATGFNSDVK